MIRTVAITLVAAACLAFQERATFRNAVDLVNFGVTVVDRQGQPVTGLTAQDFDVYENGKKQAVQLFAAGEATGAPPLHLGLLLDTSGSMADDLDNARAAAIKFVNALDTAKDVTLVDFDTEVRVARFAASDYLRLVERIRARSADGMTALYDALGVYLSDAQSQDGRKVLVIYTDGGDTNSSLRYDELLDMLKASDVTLYAVGYVQHSGSGGVQQREQLERLAAVAGGRAYFPSSPKDLAGVFEEIRKEIDARYSLGYVSSDTRADGAWRNVDIRLVRPGLKGVKLRTRSGYYAPYKEGSQR